MAVLSELKNKYKRIAVVGMAKNAGKTTTLNYLIEEAMDEGISIGVTSTGRDGESTDVATGTNKPKIYLYAGTLVCVPSGLFEYASAGLEILRMTKYHTSLGRAMICRVIDSGYVQVAGPVLTTEQLSLSNDMFELGAEMVLIDGSVDRKSIAAPDTADAIILATGAVISRDMKKVAEETAHTANIYSLSAIDDANAGIFENRDKITIKNTEKVYELDIKSALFASSILDSEIDDQTLYVYLPGALTNNVAADIHPKKFKHVTFVVKDPTKIFLSVEEWKQLRKKDFNVKVLKPINVAAISVNPISPLGYSFEHRKFLEIMQDVVGDIKVINVKL